MNIKKTAQRLQVHAATIIHMKPEQIYRRIAKMAGLKCTIGCRAGSFSGEVHPIQNIPELDLDPVFLSRFSTEELIRDTFTFLNSSRILFPEKKWEVTEETLLWNFNLHYFEFLFPLWNTFQNSGMRCYLDQAVRLIHSWIMLNPCSGEGAGWAAYTLALRITNWLSFYSLAEKELTPDFREIMVSSLHEQYVFLSNHIEKDILGNHYFEDLKALLLCSVFFQDTKMRACALRALRKECNEEILEDGMHFELSPMYHKLVLEGLMKISVALRECRYPDLELESHLQPMLDVAWSLEESMERLPLFNDGGSNVAKSLGALCSAARKYFGLEPVFRGQLPAAGYYIFKQAPWKLIVDAGQPGPSYIPGHAHCDALSFELFKDGVPVLVNCGTYAYQSELRSFFRSTSAHNTVMINGTEQSCCWDTFRLAKRSRVRVISVHDNQLTAEMRDQARHTVKRTIIINNNDLLISDESKDGHLTGYLHFLIPLGISCDCKSITEYTCPYAPDYGSFKDIRAIKYEGERRISLRICLED